MTAMGSNAESTFSSLPLGLDGRDVRDTTVDVEIGADASPATVSVMHPQRVMESRIANVQTSDIDDPTDGPAGLDHNRPE